MGYDILGMIPEDGQVIGSVGCGQAATEAVLVRGGRAVHGVDINQSSISTASHRLTTARIVGPDERDIFGDASLDGLILADVIEHMAEAHNALQRLAKSVKPGGWVVISVPSMRNFRVIREFLVRGDWPEHEREIFDRTHIQVMTKRRLERWCARAGLQIEKWFDHYDSDGRASYSIQRGIDLATFQRFHEFFMFQLKVRCRKENSKTLVLS